MPRGRSRPARALTLLEVVISITLITMLIGALLTFYFETIKVRMYAARVADRTEIARLVLERMASELRGCLGVADFGFPVEQRLAGDRRSIQLLTTALPSKEQYQFYSEFDELPPGQHDLRQVGYQLWIDPEQQTDEGEPLVGGILRTEKKTLNQVVVDEQNPEQIRHDLWSPELRYLEFRYFDGVEWTTTWDVGSGEAQTAEQPTTQESGGNPLPQLVQITVGFDPLTRAELEDQDLSSYPLEQYPLGDDQPHPDRYSTIVRISAADRFFSSRLQRTGRDASDLLGVEGGLK